MGPKAKAKPRAKSIPKAKPKPAAAVKAKAAPESSSEVHRLNVLLRACLAEPEIARVDGRVLDIAVGQARNEEGVDNSLLKRAEARLDEFHAFEAELRRHADEMRARKAEVLEQHAEENQAFAGVRNVRKGVKKRIEGLLDAAGEGDLSGVREHLDGTGVAAAAPRLPVDVEDHEGNTPLSEAACYGEVGVVELLLERGAHPNARNLQGRTPLWRATYNGHEKVVRLLLERGGDPAIENNQGEPPGKFGTAATKAAIEAWDPNRTKEGRDRLSELQRLGEPWPRTLLAASRAGDTACAAQILRAIASEEAVEFGSATAPLSTVVDFEHAADALWSACACGHLEVCRVLLDARADVDTCSETGLTALMVACRKGHREVVSELLRHGARTYLRSDQDRLALEYAGEPGGAVGDKVWGLVLEHCREREEWSSLEAAQKAGDLRSDGLAVAPASGNLGASAAITAELRGMSADELREGGERYQQLLEQRALADVLGIG